MSSDAPQPQAAEPPAQAAATVRKNRWSWKAKLEASKIRRAMEALGSEKDLSAADKRKQAGELKGRMAAIERPPRNDGRKFPDRKTQRESRRARAKAQAVARSQAGASQENPGSSSLPSSQTPGGARRVTRSMTTGKPASASGEAAESSQSKDGMVAKVARRPKNP